METKNIWGVIAIGTNGFWIEQCFESYDDAIEFLNEYEKKNKKDVIRDSKETLFDSFTNINFSIEKTELITNKKEEK